MKEDVIFVRDRRLPRHYTIDNEVYDLHLGVFAIGVYNALARHASYEGESIEQAVISQKQIASELGISVRSVQRGLDKLIEARLVFVESGKEAGAPNIYVLLEVEKSENRRKYQRREGATERRTPRKGGATKGRTPTTEGRTPATEGRTPMTDRRTPKRSKASAGMVFSGDSEGAKKEKGKEKLKAADAAKYELTLENFTNRVISWHKQCAKATRKSYDPYKIATWLGPHIRHIGLERVAEIFNHVAQGVNPHVNAFWQALREEREKQNTALAVVEEQMLADMPV